MDTIPNWAAVIAELQREFAPWNGKGEEARLRLDMGETSEPFQQQLSARRLFLRALDELHPQFLHSLLSPDRLDCYRSACASIANLFPEPMDWGPREAEPIVETRVFQIALCGATDSPLPNEHPARRLAADLVGLTEPLGLDLPWFFLSALRTLDRYSGLPGYNYPPLPIDKYGYFSQLHGDSYAHVRRKMDSAGVHGADKVLPLRYNQRLETKADAFARLKREFEATWTSQKSGEDTAIPSFPPECPAWVVRFQLQGATYKELAEERWDRKEDARVADLLAKRLPAPRRCRPNRLDADPIRDEIERFSDLLPITRRSAESGHRAIQLRDRLNETRGK